jgi:hypothetical protein
MASFLFVFTFFVWVILLITHFWGTVLWTMAFFLIGGSIVCGATGGRRNRNY